MKLGAWVRDRNSVLKCDLLKLRRSTDRLANCVWLPRFIDKCRQHKAGTLHPDFALPFCHAKATDGVFLSHFGLTAESICQAIEESSGDDSKVVSWFLQQPGCSPEKIAAWNNLAPNLGKEGYPVEKGFQWAKKHWYGGEQIDPRVVSVFTGIAFDEGYLDEICPSGR